MSQLIHCSSSSYASKSHACTERSAKDYFQSVLSWLHSWDAPSCTALFCLGLDSPARSARSRCSPDSKTHLLFCHAMPVVQNSNHLPDPSPAHFHCPKEQKCSRVRYQTHFHLIHLYSTADLSPTASPKGVSAFKPTPLLQWQRHLRNMLQIS